jgi:hypothetical protein
MNIYAQVLDNSEVEKVEKTEFTPNASCNKVLSQVQFGHVGMTVGQGT